MHKYTDTKIHVILPMPKNTVTFPHVTVFFRFSVNVTNSPQLYFDLSILETLILHFRKGNRLFPASLDR